MRRSMRKKKRLKKYESKRWTRVKSKPEGGRVKGESKEKNKKQMRGNVEEETRGLEGGREEREREGDERGGGGA